MPNAEYQSLYRKYRPQTFEDVVGQEHVTRTLQNSVRINHLAHAYLFCGPRGTGKTTSARLLAKALNCEKGPTDKPCCQCDFCLRVQNNQPLMDLIEIDAASHTGVDNVRDVIVDRAGFAPAEGRYRVYVVDECFRYEDLVTLADGSKLPIGKIVEERFNVEVLSYNERTHRLEPKPVVRHMRKQPKLPMVRVAFDNNRALVCTLNHKFYTPQGQMHAGELEVGQFVYAGYERITQHQLTVIAGAALGDGHVSLTGSRMRARLRITQGVAQKEYLDYKMQLLGDLVETPPRYQYSPESFSLKGTYRLATVSRPPIAELHRELYDHHGRKQISRAYLDRLTPLGLALWYLDDGSLITATNPYTRKDGTVTHYPATRSLLSVYGFSVAEAHLIMQWLQEKWGIEGGVTATAKGPVIWLTLAGTERLHEIIAPYVPPSMAYKLLPHHRDRFCPPTDDGTPAGLAISIVRSIERVTPPEFVYNIEVADNHNYFARDILVANCHMLSTSAFNALLKTLEEPPKHVVFVLATTDVHRVPATITSRCQRFDFKRVTAKDTIARLRTVAKQEKIKIDDAALIAIARAADGSMRDALGLLEQLSAFGSETITEEDVHAVLGTVAKDLLLNLSDAMARRDTAAALALLHDAINDGKSVPQLVHSLCDHFRDLLFLSVGYQGDTLLSSSDFSRYSEQAQAFGKPRISQIIDLLCQAEKDMKWNPEHRLVAELALFKATMDWQPAPTVTPAQPVAQPATVSQTPQAAATQPAPAPSAETAPPPPEPDGQPASTTSLESVTSSDELRDHWSDILQRLRRRLGVPLVALLQEAEPEFEDKNIVLRFTKQFHHDKVRDESKRRVVEEVLSEFFGERRVVRCEMVDATAQRTSATETLPSKSPDKDIVSLALSLFDAEIEENGEEPKGK